jgi:hypothetical protein
MGQEQTGARVKSKTHRAGAHLFGIGQEQEYPRSNPGFIWEES